jgi:hypothetical protein
LTRADAGLVQVRRDEVRARPLEHHRAHALMMAPTRSGPTGPGPPRHPDRRAPAGL